MSNSPNIDTRLAKLETLVEGLAGTVQTLAESVGTLTNRVSGVGKLRMETVVALLGLIIGLWGFAIKPKEEQIQSLQASELRSRDRLDAITTMLHAHVTNTSTNMKLLETQLAAQSRMSSQAIQQVHTLIGIQWQETKGYMPPMPTFWPGMGVESSAGG